MQPGKSLCKVRLKKIGFFVFQMLTGQYPVCHIQTAKGTLVVVCCSVNMSRKYLNIYCLSGRKIILSFEKRTQLTQFSKNNTNK